MLSRVSLRRVGASSGKLVRVPDTLAELLQHATEKLSLQSPATAIVNTAGDELDDLELLMPDEVVESPPPLEVGRSPPPLTALSASRCRSVARCFCALCGSGVATW